MAIVNKMRIHGDKMEDVIIVEKILRSLTPKFNFIVCSIEEAKDIEELSIDELQGSLLVHEQKLLQQETEEQALKVSTGDHSSSATRVNKGRGRGRENNDRSGFSFDQKSESYSYRDFQGRGRGRGGRHSTGFRPRSADKSKVECFRCHRYGHYKSECRTNLNKQRVERTNFVEKEEEISLLMVCHEKEETQPNMWYLDTGCSNHMCGDKKMFFDLDETYNNTVKFGDDSIVSVMGKGTVAIHPKGTSVQTISNVLYVPELKTNLLSAGQLQEKGYEISIKGGICRIQDEKLGLIAEVKMTGNRMFPLYLHNTTNSCFSARLKEEAWLWHFRYGHLNFGGLRTLYKKEMVEGLPQISAPLEICEDCVVSKQHRAQFPQRKSWRAKSPLALVHSDICGPISPISNGGKRYIITFIDDFSRKIWVYFLQEKSEAFAAFKNFKALVEKDGGNQIKVLRTNRDGEYNSLEFIDFCVKHGIKRQLTAAYTPQQNGVCERKNRTILNMVRSLLRGSGIPKSFWPEVVNWSIHILNRSPTLAVQNMTPEEAWSG